MSRPHRCPAPLRSRLMRPSDRFDPLHASRNIPTRMTHPPTTTAPTKTRESNIKETLESILVAFILAFIFRAFIVEAFVIPTGSMAPTLLGAHMRFTCNDCGYRFDVNYSSPPAREAKR